MATPQAIPYGGGFYCSLSAADGKAYCVEDGDTAGHGIIAFGQDIETAKFRIIGLLEALDATTALFSANSDVALNQINVVSLGLAVVTVLVMAVLLVATLAPMVLRMDANTAAVFHQLVEMPRHVYPVVTKRYAERLVKVHDIAQDLEQVGMKTKENKAALGDGSVDEDKKAPKVSCCKRLTSRCFSKSSEDDKKTLSLNEELSKSSKRWVILAQMSTTLIVAIIYFSVTVWVSFSLAESMVDAPSVTNAAGLRRAIITLAMHRLRIYITGGKMNGGFYMLGEDVLVAVDFAKYLQLGLMVGSEELGIRGYVREEVTDEIQKVLLFEDGCAVELEQFMAPEWLEPCKTFDKGITQHGLAGMFQHWVDEITELINYANLLNGDHSTSTYRDLITTNDTLKLWEPYLTLATLEVHYLQPLLKNSVDAYVDNTNSIVERAESQQLWALIALLTVAVAYDFVVQRLVQSLDTEMKRTRALLLMVPDDVLQKLPKLRKFLIDQRRVSPTGRGKSCCC